MKKKYKSFCHLPNQEGGPKSWLLLDRERKMEKLYGYPMDLPENDLKSRPGIVQNLVFCALVTGFGTIAYFAINSFL